MKRSVKVACGVAAVGVLALAVTVSASATSRRSAAIPAFTATQLSQLPADNWITPAGDLGGQRHSKLSQINTTNVKQLTQAFHVKLTAPQVGDPVPEHGGEASHIEYKGVLYSEDMFGRVYANSATTGTALVLRAAQLRGVLGHEAGSRPRRAVRPARRSPPPPPWPRRAASRSAPVVCTSPSRPRPRWSRSTQRRGSSVWQHVVSDVNMATRSAWHPCTTTAWSSVRRAVAIAAPPISRSRSTRRRESRCGTST